MSTSSLFLLNINDKSLTSELDIAGYRKLGVTVRTAGNFQEAVKVLQQTEIEAMIINIDHPDIDAVAMCTHFKRAAEYSHIPIIVTSVQSPGKTLKKLEQAGMDLFVEQPVPRQHFIEIVRGVLQQSTRDEGRLEIDSPVSLILESGDQVSCTAADLSKTGVLVVHRDEWQLEQTVQMSFILPGGKKPIKAAGTVVRDIPKRESKERLGYGIRFTSFEGDSQKRLEAYLIKSQRDDPKLIYYL